MRARTGNGPPAAREPIADVEVDLAPSGQPRTAARAALAPDRCSRPDMQ
ncbi:hypothetical protein [Sorangium sp. So ce854]